MKLSKIVLKKMAVELRTKTEEQLHDLLRIYNSQLSTLSDENYEYYSKALKQKIELVKQEIYIREVSNSNQVN